MKTDEFLSITDNPNLIPGIYNYCDRWCERCPMTARCSVFLTTPDLDPDDFENEEAFFKAVFDNVHDSFQISMDLLEKMAEEENIDLSQMESDESFSVQREIMQAEVKATPISILSLEYLDQGHEWLTNSNKSLKELEENLQRAALMDLPDRNPEQEALAVRDALEVIPYYLHQIHVKLIRAQTGRIRSDDWFEENNFPKDSDGSAKVALIGINRSIDSWGVLLHHLSEQQDSILSILSKLEQLRNQTETLFPNARSFKRPGFDV